jgi:uncharacterized protein (DUF305 family)
MENFAKLSLCLLVPCLSFGGASYASEASEEMHAAMKSMCEKMDGMQMSQDINQDFVKMMIPHHQSAVEMAEAYLKEGSDPKITAMAQKIIEAQNKEIEELNAWLEAHNDDSSASVK